MVFSRNFATVKLYENKTLVKISEFLQYLDTRTTVRLITNILPPHENTSKAMVLPHLAHNGDSGAHTYFVAFYHVIAHFTCRAQTCKCVFFHIPPLLEFGELWLLQLLTWPA